MGKPEEEGQIALEGNLRLPLGIIPDAPGHMIRQDVLTIFPSLLFGTSQSNGVDRVRLTSRTMCLHNTLASGAIWKRHSSLSPEKLLRKLTIRAAELHTQKLQAKFLVSWGSLYLLNGPLRSFQEMKMDGRRVTRNGPWVSPWGKATCPSANCLHSVPLKSKLFTQQNHTQDTDGLKKIITITLAEHSGLSL